MSIAESLATVRAQIAEACRAAGRDPSEVQLLAVSKVHPIEAIAEAAEAGQLDFGESYAQELRDKARARPDLRWHFIGRIQKNKAKYIAPVAHRIHALENVAQAEALLKRATGPLHALVAVNVGREPQKTGVLPEDTLDRVRALDAQEGLTITGLMCLPPFTEDPEGAAPYFAELADLAERGRADGLALNELSMGMTHDFPVAVRHGATCVRVGTAIFGPRPT